MKSWKSRVRALKKLDQAIEARFGLVTPPQRFVSNESDCACRACGELMLETVESYSDTLYGWEFGYELVRCASCGRRAVLKHLAPAGQISLGFKL